MASEPVSYVGYVLYLVKTRSFGSGVGGSGAKSSRLRFQRLVSKRQNLFLTVHIKCMQTRFIGWARIAVARMETSPHPFCRRAASRSRCAVADVRLACWPWQGSAAIRGESHFQSSA